MGTEERESSREPAAELPPGGAAEPADLVRIGAARRAVLEEGSQAEPDRTFVAFELAGEAYAIPLEWVMKIERVPPVIPVPRTPPFVRGIASLKGEIVCVVDLRHLLGLPGSTLVPRGLLVLQDGARRVAVLSDVLPDYFRVKASTIMPAPSARAGEGIVSEVIDRGGSLIALIDVRKLLDLLGSRLDA